MSRPPYIVRTDPQVALWAESMARRLTYLQSSLAEETAELRESHLAEEVNRSLQTLPGDRRKAALESLAERFPTWQMATVSFNATGAAPTPQTPDELVDALCAIAPQLSPERRATLSGRLSDAGLARETGKAIGEVALAEIQRRLKLSPSDKIDPERLGRLFAVLAEMVVTLEQLGWDVWKTLAPRSTLRRDTMTPELRVLLRRSLSGETEASTTQVYQQIERSRRLIAALLASLDAIGRGFAQNYQNHYSPDAIREAVRAEGKPGLFDNPDARAWQRYAERAEQLTLTAIENDIREHLVRLTEELARGENR